MARDEALLTLVGTDASPPTLRLYQWSPPTVSLGYFQHYADFEALGPPANTLAVVRRLTGGGAILHDLELTYSLTLPMDHPILAGGPNRLYQLAHDCIITALTGLSVHAARDGPTDDSGAARGPFFCFDRRHCFDVLVGGAKIAGSAQRRTRAAVLQHGSIILGNRFAQQSTAIVPVAFDEAIPRVRASLINEFGRLIGDPLIPGEWSADELETATSLIPKYASASWTQRPERGLNMTAQGTALGNRDA